MIPRVRVNYTARDLARAATEPSKNPDPLLEMTDLLGKFMGSDKVMPTASGRGALYLLLHCLPQRKVLMPAYTCKAVAEAARLAGKILCYAECDQNGFNSSAELFAPLIDSDTIVIATHQYGIPCRIFEMSRICSERSAVLIEDVAAALGTRIGGRLAGSFGDAAFFSFDSTKIVNVPLKGGFLACRDSGLFHRLLEAREKLTHSLGGLNALRTVLAGLALSALSNPSLYGIFHALAFRIAGRTTADSDRLAHAPTLFYTTKMTRWQARIAIPQIKRLESLITRRRELYAYYQAELSSLKHIRLPAPDTEGQWACSRFPILVPEPKQRFYYECRRRGIDLAFSFSFPQAPRTFTVTHNICAKVVNLPFYDRLQGTERDHVVRVLHEIDRTAFS
jgi:dTDP-4-amino-4,6-dideoxygalactose transaminase